MILFIAHFSSRELKIAAPCAFRHAWRRLSALLNSQVNDRKGRHYRSRGDGVGQVPIPRLALLSHYAAAVVMELPQTVLLWL